MVKNLEHISGSCLIFRLILLLILVFPLSGQDSTKVIMDNMNKLSIYERPLHCTDTKRETLYIKDNDKWEKDKDKTKIKQAINKTVNKNYPAFI